MPVTVRPAKHAPRAWRSTVDTNSAHTLLQHACREESAECKKVIQCSFHSLGSSIASDKTVVGNSNGFVHAAQHAYSQHHHLTVRPEDVWFSILAQLSFYINANAEDLRPLFVAHEGKKDLVVQAVGTIDTVDFGNLAVRMSDAMEEHLVAKDLRDWIMPAFTTTTTTDTVTAAVLMMGSLQAYFSYGFCLTCGIPSVTLLGTKEDWAVIRRRLDRLSDFGQEPEQFRQLLVPVLDHFLLSFDDPNDTLVLDFWNKIAHEYNMGSGPTWLSGWITAFCFWNCDGKPIRRGAVYRESKSVTLNPFDSEEAEVPVEADHRDEVPAVEFDASIYGQVDSEDVPGGYVSVPVTVDDNGVKIKTKMLAGSVGIAVTSSGDKLDRSVARGMFGGTREQTGDGPGLDSLQPVTGWFMYEVEGS